MVQRDFSAPIGPKPVRVSGGQFRFVVETLDDGGGNAPRLCRGIVTYTKPQPCWASADSAGFGTFGTSIPAIFSTCSRVKRQAELCHRSRGRWRGRGYARYRFPVPLPTPNQQGISYF